MDSEQLDFEWQKICDQVKTYSSIDTSQVNAFFSRLHPQAMSEDFFMLTADNDFIKTWIERHYSSYIIQAMKDLYGVDFTLALEVDINANRDDADKKTNQPASPHTSKQHMKQERSQTVTEIPNFQSQEVKSEELQTLKKDDKKTKITHKIPAQVGLLTSTYTFENFVIGDSNRMAYSMAVAVAETPGKPMLNPLFIYGKSGLGKTHLLRAIQNYIDETIGSLRTVYVDSAELVNDYMEASVAHDKDKFSYRTFKNHYEDADVLLIDDVQYLQGKKQTLDIVFQIFNNLIEQGKQIVLSADRAPKNIDIDERYGSRFSMGGIFDIQPPEVETKLGIIKSFVKEYRMTTGLLDFDVPDVIEKYIAENSGSNIRELKSAVTKVIFQMTACNTVDITLEDVKKLLENHFSGGAMKKLTIADIQKVVESYYRISHADIVGKKRARNIVYARQIAIYLCREMLDLPYNHIAKSFGGRDHTTIMYSVTNVEEKMKENREVREELETIRQMIREM